MRNFRIIYNMQRNLVKRMLYRKHDDELREKNLFFGPIKINVVRLLQNGIIFYRFQE